MTRIVISMLMLLTLTLMLTFSTYAEAKEIVATKEWQQVKEGDSIPAGLHVRMDMQTGIKWAKLLDDEEENGDHNGDHNANANANANANSMNMNMNLAITPDGSTHQMEAAAETSSQASSSSLKNAIKITQLANAELTAEASQKITSQLLEQAQREQKQQQTQKKNVMDSIAALNDFQGDATENEAEYEMMYRTLQSLPQDEIKAMGMELPDLPTDVHSISELSSDQQQVLETQVREIWAARQALLQQMEDEYLTDVVDIIAERIEALKDYFGNPMKNIRDVLKLMVEGDEEDNADADEGLGSSFTIIETLRDLEFQLMDLDNARDFHSMGGWPILVALLTDSVHGLNYELQTAIDYEVKLLQQQLNETATATVAERGARMEVVLPEATIEFLKEYQRIVWEIQGLASWCLGTSVSNVAEFHAWATEDFSDLMSGNDNDANIVNVITIILNNLVAEGTKTPSLLDMSPNDPKLQTRRKYEMYALGAVLRGNRKAIQYFSSVNGPDVLYDLFSYLVERDGDSMTLKLLSKIITLADDLVMDVVLHSDTSDGVHVGSVELDEKLVSALTTRQWCMLPLQMMDVPSRQIQIKMLETMTNLAPYCFDEKQIKDSIGKMMHIISDDGDGPIAADLVDELRYSMQ